METQAKLDQTLASDPLLAIVLLGSTLLSLLCAAGVGVLIYYLRRSGRLKFNQVLPLEFPAWLQGVILGVLGLMIYTMSAEIATDWAMALQLLAAPAALVAVMYAPGGLPAHYGLNKVSPFILPFLALLILLASFVAIIPFNLLSNLALHAMGVETTMQDPVKRFFEIDDPTKIFQLLLLAVVIAPVMEEIIFRGLLHPMLKATISTWPAILLTSLVFALIHFHLPVVAALFALAVIMSVAYEYTGSLSLCILIHMFFNAYQVGFILLLRSWIA